jgi:N-acetylglucosamine-6-phosphate deacetylase
VARLRGIFYEMEDSSLSGTAIIDLHTHGIAGLDTRMADPSAMLRIAGHHGRAGVAALLLSVYPGPMEGMRAQISAVKEAMERQAATSKPAEGSPGQGGPASILGVHLEGPFLNPVRKGALDASAFLEPREETFKRLIDGFEPVIRTMTVAPELPGAERLIRVMVKQGIRVNMGHSDATYTEADAGFRAGAGGITHLFNAMRPFHHREPGIAGFGLLNRDICVEIIGDLRHLSAETIAIILRLKRPEKILLVSDSVREACLASQAEEGKTGEKLLGGSMTLPDAARLLIQRGLDEELIMRAMTLNPREYLS